MLQPPPVRPGMREDEVDTPALLIDLDAFEANLDHMAELLAPTGAKLRAHAKTHKSPVIARLQMARGAVGQCVQKVAEAEALAWGGIPDILVSNEVVTPDSSRFWPLDGYEPGKSQPSFDKQFARDWCEKTGWDKTPPGPDLPADVVSGTRARYVEAFELLTGIPFDAYLADPEVVLA